MTIRTVQTFTLMTCAALILCTANALAQTRDGGRPQPRPDKSVPDQSPFAIDLGGAQFDPIAGVPAFDEGWNRAREDVPDMRLVQFSGPTQQAWLDELEQRGLKVVQYIHPYAYVVWGSADAIKDVAGEGRRGARAKMEAVRWAGDFLPAFRVQPNFRNLPAQVIDIRLMVYRGTDIKNVIQQVIAMGGENTGRRAIDSMFEVATFRMSGAMLQAVAQIPGVYAVRPVPTDGGLRGEMSNMINLTNVEAAVSPGYQAWLTGAGVNGTGVTIANVDGGVQETHPDLVGRFLPCVGTTCSGTSSSHGTHTAGTMAGDGSSGILSAPGGFLRGQGVAPGAKLVEQVYSPWFNNAGGMLLLMTDSSNNGASLSGNSWGPASSPLGYDDDTRQCDIGVRDADPVEPGNQPLTFVLSFMNGNGGTSTQGTPDEGKNLFTIGSTNGQTSPTSQIIDINSISANSAHGPALDGRTIPHMVAPGCSIDSTIPTNSHGLMCGTSMASPHVSGAVALFIQKYRTIPGVTSDPSPALIKAAFLGNCYDLSGNTDADGGLLGHPYDNKQGWGRMNLTAVITPPANSTRYFDAPLLLNNTGEEWSTTVSPLNPALPMRIMLVWTDAPGHGLGGSTAAWVNDLDLIVDTPGGQYRGNNFAGTGWSQTGGIADNKNNTEGVFIGPTAPGSATIRVRATNIAGDGVPNIGDITDQDFAIVVYNGAVEPGFALQVTPSSQIACAPATSPYTVQVSSILGFTNSVTLSATGLPAGASANFVPNPVTPGGSSTMTITPGAAVSGTYNVSVNGVSGPINRQSLVTYALSNGVPAVPSLTTPANNDVNVSPAPTLVWAAAAGATTYSVEVSTSPAFSSIAYSASGITGTSHAVPTALSTLTDYFWRVRGVNACGDGNFAAAFTFRTADIPAILLVDDDDNGPNVQPTYTAILDALGAQYDVWDTNNSDNEPSAAQLAPYSLVIWFTGDAWQGDLCGPGSAGEAALTTWLGTGGKCLFICSQDYHYVHDLTPFMSGYLGVSAVTNDVGQTSAAGSNVMAGYGPYTLSYTFSNFSDSMTAGNGGTAAFTGNAGTSAVSKDATTYRTMFWAFPIEAIADSADRQALMLKIINWCGDIAPECLADINSDNFVNVTDLLAVISAWGPCVDCVEEPCAADINSDCSINVTDLLAVISDWGGCD